jgi:hypothetical protein
MGERQTTVSRSIEYDTAECSHCTDEVFVDNDRENVDGLPEGIPLVIGGGEYMSVDKTDRSTLSKHHWRPKVVIKWFISDGQSADLSEQYLCRSCAKSLYGE